MNSSTPIREQQIGREKIRGHRQQATVKRFPKMRSAAGSTPGGVTQTGRKEPVAMSLVGKAVRGLIQAAMFGCWLWVVAFGLAAQREIEGCGLVTFTATDECGNTSMPQNQASTSQGTTAPTLQVPGGISLSCGASVDPNRTGGATASGDCSANILQKAQSVWINEFHYENQGGDVGEFIEVAGPAGTDLSPWKLVLYSGGTKKVYGTIRLYGLTIPNQQCGFGVVAVDAVGLQNGTAPGDAIALVMDPWDQIVEFISYGGTFTAQDGPAVGLTPNLIPVSEAGTTPVGYSV
jgi:hypothetical protein